MLMIKTEVLMTIYLMHPNKFYKVRVLYFVSVLVLDGGPEDKSLIKHHSKKIKTIFFFSVQENFWKQHLNIWKIIF